MESTYTPIAFTNEATVVTEYVPKDKKRKEYQSEAELEKDFIKRLGEIGYPYLPIHNEKDLIHNLREQIEKLNNYHFSNEGWNSFFENKICNPNDGIVEKTKNIQVDNIKEYIDEDGNLHNIMLIDKKDVHNNYCQVINQYVNNDGTHDNRYDVTVLVNGLPLVHIELKRRGVPIQEAFNQIDRYQRDSFWASTGLYEYVQIFVISNGTNTKYYSNTTRNGHIKEIAKTGRPSKKKTSNSFKFTSYWADANNKPIPDLIDFTYTFFSKHTLLNILTKYCVFTTEELLLVMRPYQIVQTERILNRILIADNYKYYGSVKAGGYIWSSTGSGKTLTSFKSAQLATEMDCVDKVVFVVDRKDLDYQTIKEYDRFQKGCANGNTSTKVLESQLSDSNAKIIITTIQKLDSFVKKNQTHPIYNKKVVLVFDECHRSQFGSMHAAIVKKFKKYFIFGFTGTPIFAENATTKGKHFELMTTEQAFGDRLHTYTIVDAINDENVLPFRIDFINTIKLDESMRDKDVEAINTKKALMSPERIRNNVMYLLEHFNQKTRRGSTYSLHGKRVAGFNSILCVDSIPMAMLYYSELKKQIKDQGLNLKIATIYSFNPNDEDPDGFNVDEDFETDRLDQSSHDFLDAAINDYNLMFHTNYDSSSNGFQDYYKDLSQKMKDREVDLLVVVNMFLTGFDATTLNTLWVDKNLKMHGLIQAFSRTNRILNSVKTYGNIVCFRDLEEETERAIALFGDKDAKSIVLLKDFNSYYNGYDDEDGTHHYGYVDYIDRLTQQYPLHPVRFVLIGEKAEKEFISLWNNILKIRNVLASFDDFSGKEILTAIDFQDYQSIYIDLYNKWRKQKKAEQEDINDDVIFEVELVKQIEVNIDYILALVAKYHQSNCEDKTLLVSITKAIDSSIKLRSKKELIINFIDRYNKDQDVSDEWRNYVEKQKEEDLDKIINEEKLDSDRTHSYLNHALQDGVLSTNGIEFESMLPKVSLFKKKSLRERVIEKLQAFFEKYFDIF